MPKKIIITLVLAAALTAPAVHAAEEQVRFNTANRTLSIAGTCAHPEVLVLIRIATDNRIWASSNPSCSNGTYAYSQSITDSKLGPDDLRVEIIDGGYAEKARRDAEANAPTSKTKLPMPTSVSLPIETLTAAPALTLATPDPEPETPPDDGFSLNGVLANVFHAMQAVMDGVQQFTALLADNIKAGTLAALRLFVHDATITPGGSLALPEGQDEMSGRAVLSAGQTEVIVSNASVSSTDRILLTPTTPSDVAPAVVRRLAGQSFTVGISRVLDHDLAFDWVIFKTYRADGGQGAENAERLAPALLIVPTIVPTPPALSPPITEPDELLSPEVPPESPSSTLEDISPPADPPPPPAESSLSPTPPPPTEAPPPLSPPDPSSTIDQIPNP